jgi:hypothetical protein
LPGRRPGQGFKGCDLRVGENGRWRMEYRFSIFYPPSSTRRVILRICSIQIFQFKRFVD